MGPVEYLQAKKWDSDSMVGCVIRNIVFHIRTSKMNRDVDVCVSSFEMYYIFKKYKKWIDFIKLLIFYIYIIANIWSCYILISHEFVSHQVAHIYAL